MNTAEISASKMNRGGKVCYYYWELPYTAINEGNRNNEDDSVVMSCSPNEWRCSN
jgi:hypothetical protein